jgi:hypothetical protein
MNGGLKCLVRSHARSTLYWREYLRRLPVEQTHNEKFDSGPLAAR